MAAAVVRAGGAGGPMSRVPWWLLVTFAAAMVAEWLVWAHKGEVPWHHATPTFHAWYGVAGCMAIVLVSKALGKWLLQRPEGDEEER